MPDHGAPRVIPGGVLGGSSGHDLDGLGGPSAGRLFFVVGAFDGLHRGHTYLLARLRAAAARHAARPAVITFDHHPDEILVGAAPPVLCDPAERLVRFGRTGVEVVVVQHFDVTVRMTPYADFVAAIAQRFELAGFLMTPDAAFGHERRGTALALAELGRSMGYSLDVVAPLSIDGRAVSSTEIRSEIAVGDLGAARRLLGRSVAVVGRLDEGRVTFDLPVALPPPARYRVDVEPAWAPGRPRSGRRTPAIGMVAVRDSGTSLSLEFRRAAGLPTSEPLRIRFIGPA